MRFWLAVAALAPVILPERADSADAKVLIAELEQELDPRYPKRAGVDGARSPAPGGLLIVAWVVASKLAH